MLVSRFIVGLTVGEWVALGALFLGGSSVLGYFTARASARKLNADAALAAAQGRKADAEAEHLAVDAADKAMTLQNETIKRLEVRVGELTESRAADRLASTTAITTLQTIVDEEVAHRKRLEERLAAVQAWARQLSAQIVELGGKPVPFPGDEPGLAPA